MLILIEMPDSKIPKHQAIIDIPLHFIDKTVCDAGGYRFECLTVDDAFEAVIESLQNKGLTESAGERCYGKNKC